MRDFREFVIDLLPITFRSVSAVGLERPRGSRPKPTRPRPNPTRPRPRPRPQPTRPRPRPGFFGLEAEARPRGLTSLIICNSLYHHPMTSTRQHPGPQSLTAILVPHNISSTYIFSEAFYNLIIVFTFYYVTFHHFLILHWYSYK